MNRRRLIRNCSLVAGGLAAAKTMRLWPQPLFAAPAAMSQFSLNVLTSDPDRAVPVVESLITGSNLPAGRLRVTESTLAGCHIGDLVFIRNNRLVDFWQGADEFSLRLRELARSLGFPKTLTNPVLLEFRSGWKSSPAQTLNVFHKNIRIEQLALDVDQSAYKVMGSKGNVKFCVHDRTVKIIEAACRHQTCKQMGAIARPGQSLVCLPNELRLTIEGKNQQGLDGITY